MGAPVRLEHAPIRGLWIHMGGGKFCIENVGLVRDLQWAARGVHTSHRALVEAGVASRHPLGNPLWEVGVGAPHYFNAKSSSIHGPC